ncbi:NAD-P-binding protein [Artomyces pyxidatus]|uniref:NAD-P-binding protein n=1 Tax=Artomyces pyxidatus TaxID=48021 RepID=A0ACB8ST07_9AGAM|nr:NAD-P-binding protein [Artomyces pyxidatus]
MSPVLPPAKVLVTGANGFVAAWVVRKLLEAGYAVRGTVRSASKGTHLKNTFAKYGDKFEVFVVDDITKDGAFDEAVQGVDIVEHTASPFHFAAKEPDDLIIPAVRGTVSVLESIKKYGTSVKRVVITASIVAVFHPAEYPAVYNETDWNDFSVSEVKAKGAAVGGYPMYQASKTLAEHAAWDFVEANKASLGWDLVTINPPWIFGPPIHEVPSLEQLNTSQSQILTTLSGKRTDKKELTEQGNWVDVRTVADAHVAAVQKAEAGGERIIVSTGTFVWQDILDAANAISPPPFASIQKGFPGAGKDIVHDVAYDTAKEKRILGLEHVSLEQMVADSIADFKARGYTL